MRRGHVILLFVTAVKCLVHGTEPSSEPALTKAERDFFEAKIRPVLIEHCHRCHSVGGKEVKADFLLDTREGIRKGGASGRDAVIPGDPAGSPLLAAIRHTDSDFQMPPNTKLPDAVAADFEAWITMGAPDPRDGISRLPRESATETHWAFQPIASPEPPAVADESWPRDRIDRFVLARLEAAGLKPVRDATSA